MLFKSDRRGSNPRPRPWQGRTLPAEPLSHFSVPLTGTIHTILRTKRNVNTFFIFYHKLHSWIVFQKFFKTFLFLITFKEFSAPYIFALHLTHFDAILFMYLYYSERSPIIMKFIYPAVFRKNESGGTMHISRILNAAKHREILSTMQSTMQMKPPATGSW